MGGTEDGKNMIKYSNEIIKEQIKKLNGPYLLR